MDTVTTESEEAMTIDFDSEGAAMETSEVLQGEVRNSVTSRRCNLVKDIFWRMPERFYTKKIICKGQGVASPVLGSVCNVELQVTSVSDELDKLDLGFPQGETVVQIGEGDKVLSHILDFVLITMKRLEKSEVLVHDVPEIEGELVLHITLVEFTVSTPSWCMLPAEKVTVAAHHKEQGSHLFKTGHLDAAFARFSLATHLLLSVLPQTFEDDMNEAQTHKELLCQCYLNLAACQMKTGCHIHVVTNCTYALTLQPTNVKALYRRASAYISLGDFVSAHSDLEKGLLTEPSNHAFTHLLQKVNANMQQCNAQMAQGLSKMFS